MDRQIKILAWNANGITNKLADLRFFVSEHDVDIILLGETHLTPQHNLSLNPYTVYRTDRPNQNPRKPSGGSAILVHRRVTHKHIPTSTKLVESTAIQIEYRKSPITIVSAYLPPTKHPFPTDELTVLLNLSETVLIGGDLNSKHKSWGCVTSNPRGMSLKRLLNSRQDTSIVVPDLPTHYSGRKNSKPDILDVFLSKNLSHFPSLKTHNDLSSDHLPIVLTMDPTQSSTRSPPPPKMSTNWIKFRHSLESNLPALTDPSSVEELETLIKDFTESFTKSLSEASTPVSTPSTKSNTPSHILEAIDVRRKLRRQWQTHRNPEIKTLFNKQNELVKKLLVEHHSEKWTSYLSGLDTENHGHWRVAQSLRRVKHANYPLTGKNGLHFSPPDKAELFADSLEKQCSPNPPDPSISDHIEHVVESNANFFNTPPTDSLPPIEIKEISELIRKAKPKKSPGFDGITAKAIKNSPPIVLTFLQKIFNTALKLNHFPSTWKIAKIILLPKAKKDLTIPENHRPISLLPIFSKFFEKLLLHRILPFIKDHIRPEQFGFRPEHSTTQQLTRVLNILTDNKNKNKASVVTLLDVSKAFDKVWHDGLLYKLIQTTIPRSAIHILKSYLTNRKFFTFVEGFASSTRPIRSGVPQGSVLGPILYTIYTNDMPLTKDTTLSLYADDAGFITSSHSPQRAVSLMQSQLNIIHPWLLKWRTVVNADKSEAILIKKKKRKKAITSEVTLNNTPIPWQKKVKYLGLVVDQKLNLCAHANSRISQGKQVHGFLRPLLCPKSPIPIKTKIMLYSMIIRPIIMYAAPSWWALASPSKIKTLESLQSKILRHITKMPWFVSNKTIRESANIPTLSTFAKDTAKRFFDKAKTSSYPHIQEIAEAQGFYEFFVKKPAAILNNTP